jgi:hypothetical protein
MPQQEAVENWMHEHEPMQLSVGDRALLKDTIHLEAPLLGLCLGLESSHRAKRASEGGPMQTSTAPPAAAIEPNAQQSPRGSLLCSISKRSGPTAVAATVRQHNKKVHQVSQQVRRIPQKQ